MNVELADADVARFLASVHPYDALPPEDLTETASRFESYDYQRGDEIYAVGQSLQGLYLIYSGSVEVRDQRGGQVSLLGTRNSFGERGLVRDGIAVTSAYAAETTRLFVLPVAAFRALVERNETFAKFFNRSAAEANRPPSLATIAVSSLMTREPITCAPETPILQAARMMRERGISSLGVLDGETLVGIVTTRDLGNRVVAEGRDPHGPVAEVMTRAPITLSPDSLGSDVLHIMHERQIGHVPIVEDGILRGMVTQTDLTRLQAVTSAHFVADIARAEDAAGLARVTEQIPQLLVSLVGAGNRHEVVTRLITDIADAATRRLLMLAEAMLGPPPVPYLWMACGSQGRREQSGISDQDNCLLLDDKVRDSDLGYFEQMSDFVCAGLNECGYVFCPGEMMASNPRWRQPAHVWRDYFAGWIAKPNPEAQMLASVMFDLRPIGGTEALFRDLQGETLAMASKNSIFVAHMVSNSLKHTPPLGMLRGFAKIRSGEHRNRIDMKMNGVVPVVDLARVYALQGKLTPVNTRARLETAARAGVLSIAGAGDLIDAYDLIAQTRLEHQTDLVKTGAAPDNYLALTELSDFERSHLRDAFVVVRTMQSAIGHGKAMLG